MANAAPHKPPTIREIAKKAGVSTSTVSRILRGDAKETWQSSARRAEMIRSLAREMGYRKNWRASAFVQQRTWTIGLLSTREGKLIEGVHGDFTTGFNDVLSARGYNLMLLQAENPQFEDIVMGSRLDGCAILSDLPQRQRALLEQSGMPAVLLNSDTDRSLPRIVVDDYAGGVSAAEHLIGLGHRRIGYYVKSHVRPHLSVSERLRGINHAMKDAGLGAAHFYNQSHDTFVDVLRDPALRPTALICYSQTEAISVLSSLYRLGVRVPGDISVLGFNDVYPAAELSPPLTTVSYDARRLGKVGAQLLLRRLERPEDSTASAYSLKHHVVLRESTGPAPDRG